MERNQRESFELLLKISHDMHSSASDEAWEEVVDLEMRRQDVIKKCFSFEISEKDSSYVARAIEQILEINRQLASMGGNARQHLAASISQQNQSKSACEAYSNALAL